MKGEAIFFEYNYIAVVSMNFMNSGNDVLYYILCVVSAVIVLPMLLYWMWNKLRQQMIKDSIKCWACFGILGVLLIEIFSVFYLACGVIKISEEEVDLSAAAELTSAFVTAISVLGAGIGYFYSKRQDKIQAIHTEGEWRRRLFDLEKEPEYQISDLIELASLIDIVPNNEKVLALYVNAVMIEILKNHGANSDGEMRLNEPISKRFEVLCDKCNLRPSVTKLLKLHPKDTALEKTVYDYDITSIKNEILIHPEENEIRRCIHALLKDDWENVTN